MATNDKITGAVKFFDKNFALFRDGATATATSNEDSVNLLLDISRYTQWESIGSNDITTEKVIITFNSPKTMDTLFLVDMNLKNFEVKYDNGGVFEDFTNVFSVNNESKSSVSETDYNRDTAFYQFDEITTSSIEITMNTTQTANEDKFITQVIASKEIGTLQGFPRVQPESNRNETRAKALSRRLLIQKTYETNRIRMNFKTHPFQNDLDIIENLFDREEPFLVYPCGGRTGSPYFKVEQKNWLLRDVYNVQLMGKLKNEFEKGVYSLGFNKTIMMEEHI